MVWTTTDRTAHLDATPCVGEKLVFETRLMNATEYSIETSYSSTSAGIHRSRVDTTVEAVLAPGERTTFVFVRGQAPRLALPSEDVAAYEARTADACAAWLREGIPSDELKVTEDEKLFYEISLLTTKYSQHPVHGGLVASFHPDYGYKVWTRDAMFSTLILTASGHRAEAERALSFLAGVVLRGDNAPHTCYDWFSNGVADFVEPQYDGVGAALVAYYAFFKKFGNATEFERRWGSRVRALEEAGRGPDYSIWEESSDHHTREPLNPSYFTFSQAMRYAGLEAAACLEEEVFRQADRAAALRGEADELRERVRTLMWSGERGHYCRNIDSVTNETNWTPDASTHAAVFCGLERDVVRVKSHVSAVAANLTRLTSGSGRYWGDPYFYDSAWNPAGAAETGSAMPPWGVATMFTAWAEYAAEAMISEWDDDKTKLHTSIQSRLQWMVDYACRPLMPAGEAIDGDTGEVVMSSTPDIYEHGGVFAYTCLIVNGIANCCICK